MRAFFSFLVTPGPPTSTLFPYTTLFRSPELRSRAMSCASRSRLNITRLLCGKPSSDNDWRALANRDRKSTRLNSSHVRISYAVFCLKKKTDADDNELEGNGDDATAHRAR